MESDLKKRRLEFLDLESLDDGVLYKILLLLPDQRTAFRCKKVCKRWRSLISHPKFASEFIKHRTNRLSDDAPVPLTLLTQIETRIIKVEVTTENNHEFYADNGVGGGGSGSGSGSGVGSYLSFLPWSERAEVKASWGDLLLVSKHWPKTRLKSKNDFIVCNPVTKQWVAIPPSPLEDMYCDDNCGLFCESGDNNSIRFKVFFTFLSRNLASFNLCTFCSETREWTKKLFIRPVERHITGYGNVVVVTDGALHFMRVDHIRPVGIYVIFLLNDPKSMIFYDLPEGFSGGWRSSFENTHLGVVRGRLRLSQMFACNHGFSLKVWEFGAELSASSPTWVVIHNLMVKRPNKTNKKKAYSVFVAAFDPNDGDTVFLVDGFGIFRYEIDSSKCVKVFDVRSERHCLNPRFTNTFTLMQPAWHTTIPSLPVPSSLSI